MKSNYIICFQTCIQFPNPPSTLALYSAKVSWPLVCFDHTDCNPLMREKSHGFVELERFLGII